MTNEYRIEPTGPAFTVIGGLAEQRKGSGVSARSFNPMKITSLFLALIGLSSILQAQRKTSTQVSKPSIEIEGVKLHLGMTKGDVAERYVGTSVKKMTEDRWTIGKWGMVGFKSGKLVFAEHSWNNVGDDQFDAIFGVVSSMNRQGYISCKVLADNKSVPVTDASTGRTLAALSGNFERVWIACGAKTVVIVKSKVGDRLNEDVSEQLGDLEIDSE